MIKFESYSPHKLLKVYRASSLLVLIVCLVITTSVYTYNFLQKEKARAVLSKSQLEHFFDFEYRAMAEEMWTGNLESISLRVLRIAERFGNAPYTLYLTDSLGKCLGTASDKLQLYTNCKIPEELLKAKELYLVNSKLHNIPESIYFNKKINKYIYISQLSVDQTSKGYMYVEMGDPYNFYRGGFFWHVLKILIPTILIISIIWLIWLFFSKRKILKPYFNAIVELEKDRALGRLAAQVAHDIRSPLAALDLVTQSIISLPEDQRIIVRSAVSRIKDIANNLLEARFIKNKVKLNSDTDLRLNEAYEKNFSKQFLSSLIDRLISEKRMQYRAKIGLEIENLCMCSEAYGLFAFVPADDLKRVLSNLIDNSIEAISEHGKVTISIGSMNEYINLTVKDNGIGIPENIINSLGQAGFTYNKRHGTGLGLYYVKNSMESWGGKFKLESKVSEGTCVSLLIPKSTAPKWFLPEISVFPDTSIIIIDDDTSVHQIWKKRFESISVPSSHHTLQLFHLSSPAEISEWQIKHPLHINKAIYLCDYEFINSVESGLTIIEKLNIKKQSILVTSHFDDKKLQIRCEEADVKLVPKGMTGFVPIKFLDLKQDGSLCKRLDVVLIDNDQLIHKTWDITAKLSRIRFKAVSSLKDFYLITESLSLNTFIYVDIELDNGIKGDLVSKEIFNLGYKNIYLSTGFLPENFHMPEWVRGVIGKEPPWKY